LAAKVFKKFYGAGDSTTQRRRVALLVRTHALFSARSRACRAQRQVSRETASRRWEKYRARMPATDAGWDALVAADDAEHGVVDASGDDLGGDGADDAPADV
jgi:hypothetical protein